MSDRALRGTGLSSHSNQDSVGVELAPRRNVEFVCPEGHDFTIVFAQEAELPTQWACPRCGEQGKRADGSESETPAEKPQRTHWDMLRERRSIKELEDLLSERIQELRADDPDAV